MSRIYTIETRKESLKFCAAHMASYSGGSVERLHGHNYQVWARLSGRLDAAGMVLDVGVLKSWVRGICEELDERVLVALKNPIIKVEADDKTVALQCAAKRYVLPREDCVLLPLPNTTMEHLAAYVAERLSERLRREPEGARMSELTVSVGETPGQWASWTLQPGDPH